MSEIEERCLALPKGERVRLIQMLTKSLDDNARTRRLEEIWQAVIKVMGVQIPAKSRERQYCVGRVIFSYIAFLEGYTESETGRFINRNHSSVNTMKRNMKDWLQYPAMYCDEVTKYLKTRELLSYETDR